MQATSSPLPPGAAGGDVSGASPASGPTKSVHFQSSAAAAAAALSGVVGLTAAPTTSSAVTTNPSSPAAQSPYGSIFDPFPNRCTKYFWISPKSGMQSDDLVREMRLWVKTTFGETVLRDWNQGINLIDRYRESVLFIGSLNVASGDVEATFHTAFDEVHSKAIFSYIRLLTEFVNKTRGTAAAKGLGEQEKFALVWAHPFESATIKAASTDSLSYELYAAIWNLAAAYSIYAALLPPTLKHESSYNKDSGYVESLRCYQHRNRNFRRAAMVLVLLDKVIRRTGFFVDEFRPQVCNVLRLVMLAQAQSAVYFGRKGAEEIARRFEHASLANGAVAYYREAVMAVEALGQKEPVPAQRDLNNAAEHLPSYLRAYLYSCGTFIKTSMVVHMMEVDRADPRATVHHGRIMGNCFRICTMIEAYLQRMASIPDSSQVAQLEIFTEVLNDYRQIYQTMEDKNRIYKEQMWGIAELETSDAEPRDEVSLSLIGTITDGLREVFCEEPLNKFAGIPSLESQRFWLSYRKRRATQYRMQQSQLSTWTNSLVGMLESPVSIFPLVWLYFVAHALGSSGKVTLPANTSLWKRMRAVFQGESAWTAFTSAQQNISSLDRDTAALIGELGVSANDITTLIRRLNTQEVINFSLNTPAERAQVIGEEYRTFKADIIKADVMNTALELRRSDPFAREMQKHIAMPDGFWVQVTNPQQRQPRAEEHTNSDTVSPPHVPPKTEGDQLVDDMDSAKVDASAEAAKNALKTPTRGGLFGMMFSSSSSSSSSSSASVAIEPIVSTQAALNQQQPPNPTPFSAANSSLKTVKLMRLVVRLIDDIYLRLEELHDELSQRLIKDMEEQNTEIPPTEISPDMDQARLKWLSDFTIATADLMTTGKHILDDISKIDHGKEAIVEELRTNFGYTAAGGPNYGSSSTFFNTYAVMSNAMRNYRLCVGVFSLLLKEGVFVAAQCKDVLAKLTTMASAARRGAALYQRPHLTTTTPSTALSPSTTNVPMITTTTTSTIRQPIGMTTEEATLLMEEEENEIAHATRQPATATAAAHQMYVQQQYQRTAAAAMAVSNRGATPGNAASSSGGALRRRGGAAGDSHGLSSPFSPVLGGVINNSSSSVAII